MDVRLYAFKIMLELIFDLPCCIGLTFCDERLHIHGRHIVHDFIALFLEFRKFRFKLSGFFLINVIDCFSQFVNRRNHRAHIGEVL